MKKPDVTVWLARLDSNGLRTLLLALLLVVTAQVLAKTLWMVMAGPQDVVPVAADLRVISPSTAANGLPLNQPTLEQWALFGKSQASATNTQKNAPETTLKLTLLGVFAHPDDALSGAIIASSSEDGKLYHPGDDLPGNAVLYKVYADKVLIKRLGNIETLSFEKAQLSGSIAASSAPAADTSGLAQQRNMVISQLALEPLRPGSPQGYKVTDKITKDVQNAVGLKPGDVILSVNGLPLGTAQTDQAAMQSFYASGKAEVQVQRGSSTLTLTYPP